MREARLDCPDSDEETDCDELGGTDEDAVNRHEHDDAHILEHALWVETSYIPRADCLADRKKLKWGKLDDWVECFMDENGHC